ncbi:hypothetical protein SCLCIDRAFT_722404 [Scleroderma citrinum Foug A]|uniref:Cation efflux protein transmembrane domain-containing protein n=1 Tax=Scleroderma citrinum Foug A TaxID=1036808 RepID=A0A0C3A7P5_9AGAM|nr:hypothetical protein SCLCIDRAFT_722404 [Scleroderma citrinum Foug A]
MVSRRALQRFAIAISILSVFYNGAEGIVSVLFGVDSSSRSLIFFGIQSAIEVISSALVTWRFIAAVRSGDEDALDSRAPRIIKVEKIATTAIGCLLIVLALAAIGTSIASLIAHEHPSHSDATLIISGSTILITFFLWIPKRYLAHALNSSTMQGEALCALSCIQFSFVLLVGSLIYRVWRNGWWVDSATAMVIALLFGWEGIKMVRFAQHKEFSGGCCGHDSRKETVKTTTVVPLPETQSCANSCSSGSCQCSVKEMAIPAAEHV